MNISDYLSKQLQSGEEVVQVIKRHPITLVPALGFGAILILIDFFLVAWWFQHRQWGVYGFFGLAAIGLGAMIRSWYIWSHNMLAITTKRVIDIDQRGFFERNVAETTYAKIEDVRYTIRGLWPTLFRFGTIVVQTAGSTTNLELEGVRRPMDVQQLITDLQREQEQTGTSDVSAAELLKVVSRLKDELGPDGVERVLRKSVHPRDG